MSVYVLALYYAEKPFKKDALLHMSSHSPVMYYIKVYPVTYLYIVQGGFTRLSGAYPRGPTRRGTP